MGLQRLRKSINIASYLSKFFSFLQSTEGVVELWLTSEDTGAYGKDIGVRLPDLLWQIIEVIPKGCMMRIGMTNPPYIQEYLPVGCLFNCSSENIKNSLCAL